MNNRKKKGRNIDGWLLVDKPEGLSSTAVVNKIKWCFDAKKAGHSGTLDPAATGLLAIALGEATKTIPIITESLKSYDFIINLGSQTNTDDMEGEIIETSTFRPSKEDIVQALTKFRGHIKQVPPQFSAVKVNGERAYAKARKGELLELKSRPLLVNSLNIIKIHNENSISLRMECGKGGYVRSIARDLGIELGCLAHVQSLRRTISGPFNISEANAYDLFKSTGKDLSLDRLLLPLELGLTGLTELTTTSEGAIQLRQGQPLKIPNCELADDTLAWVSSDSRAIAMVTYKAGNLYPSRVFSQNDY
jgi:tRNA pseudouridine55 synthase